MKASLVCGNRSYSLLNRLFVVSQAKVRSTTQRLGSTRKPTGGSILDQSITASTASTASTAFAGAHTPRGLQGCLTISTLQPLRSSLMYSLPTHQSLPCTHHLTR